MAISALHLKQSMTDADAGSRSRAEMISPAADGLPLLIQACLRNERIAQRQLYETFSPLVFGIIRRYADDLTLAQDLQSEVFCRIFGRLSQYRFEGAFEGWIRRVTVHAVSDHFRYDHHHTVALQEDTEDLPQYCPEDGLSNLSYKELLALIHALPPMHRAVFNLAVFEQYPHKEIGALLGITENNSRWHLNAARRRLQQQIIAISR